MSGQVKRGPGRPRTGRERRAVTLTLTNEVAAFLERLPPGIRSKFVDDWLREQPQIKEKLMFINQPTEALLQRLAELKALQFTTPDTRIEQAGIENELRKRGVLPARPTTWQPREDEDNASD